MTFPILLKNVFHVVTNWDALDRPFVPPAHYYTRHGNETFLNPTGVCQICFNLKRFPIFTPLNWIFCVRHAGYLEDNRNSFSFFRRLLAHFYSWKNTFHVLNCLSGFLGLITSHLAIQKSHFIAGIMCASITLVGWINGPLELSPYIPDTQTYIGTHPYIMLLQHVNHNHFRWCNKIMITQGQGP